MAERSGKAAGVPYFAFEPHTEAGKDRLVVVLHLMDPPRSERAMAAAVPLHAVDAWRVYLALPMTGSRAPVGGFAEIQRLATEDVLMNILAPAIEQASDELPAVVAELRRELTIGEGPLALVGGSAGGAAVLRTLCERILAVKAAVLINPATQAEAVIESGERHFGATYAWNDANRAKAAELDFVKRAPEIVGRTPLVPLLFVVGQEDEAAFKDSTMKLFEVLRPSYDDGSTLALVTVSGLGHGLADEPGIEPAPQIAGAFIVDDAAAGWLNRFLH